MVMLRALIILVALSVQNQANEILSLTPWEALEYATEMFNNNVDNDPKTRRTVIEILEAVDKIGEGGEGLASGDANAEGLEDHLRHLPSFYLAAIYHFGGGEVHRQGDADNLETAIRLYKRAISINPSHSDSLNNLGKLYNDLGEADSAFEYYSKATNADPNHVQSRINLGLFLHRLGRFSQATETYEEARNIGGISPVERSEINYNLGVSYQFMGEVLNAVDCYRLAIGAKLEVDEEYPEACINLSALHHKHGRLEDAVSHYKVSFFFFLSMIFVDC